LRICSAASLDSEKRRRICLAANLREKKDFVFFQPQVYRRKKILSFFSRKFAGEEIQSICFAASRIPNRYVRNEKKILVDSHREKVSVQEGNVLSLRAIE
jgi:hypothetical protein